MKYSTEGKFQQPCHPDGTMQEKKLDLTGDHKLYRFEVEVSIFLVV